MKVYTLHNMLLGFDILLLLVISKICSYLVQVILQCFYMNMHLPIGFCYGMHC